MIPVNHLMTGALASILRHAPLTPEKVAFSWRTAVGPAVDKVTAVEFHDGVLYVREGRRLAARGRAFRRADPVAAGRVAGGSRRAADRGREALGRYGPHTQETADWLLPAKLSYPHVSS